MNNPTVQYLIEAYLPGSTVAVDRFTIEQVECQHKFGCSDNGNYNTVQKHLSELTAKNGLIYSIVAWGDPMDCSEWLAGGKLND